MSGSRSLMSNVFTVCTTGSFGSANLTFSVFSSKVDRREFHFYEGEGCGNSFNRKTQAWMFFVYGVVCESYPLKKRISSLDVVASIYCAFRLRTRIWLNEKRPLVSQGLSEGTSPVSAHFFSSSCSRIFSRIYLATGRTRWGEVKARLANTSKIVNNCVHRLMFLSNTSPGATREPSRSVLIRRNSKRCFSIPRLRIWNRFGMRWIALLQLLSS